MAVFMVRNRGCDMRRSFGLVQHRPRDVRQFEGVNDVAGKRARNVIVMRR